MDLLVLNQSGAGEPRVAATPETIKRLIKEGFTPHVERGAGIGANITDDAFREAGANLIAPGSKRAEVILSVVAPSASQIQQQQTGATWIALMAPHRNTATVKLLRDQNMSAFAMELVPRISRAQNMDALSSQASIAGYRAVLLAAQQLDKYFPLLMTAAGTVQPARVVIMGAGVAGLQAIATAKRLGAVVEVSDIRPEVEEQVKSLGGRFIELPMQESGSGQGGYAKQMTPEFLAKQREIVARHVASADVVITTALVPGRPAPKLVSRDMVESMRPGAVIVDLAVEQGGNCELSKADETVIHNGVRILGEGNLPAQLPADASMLYARNLLNLLLHLYPKEKGDTELNARFARPWDLEDEIISGCLLTHGGSIRHAPTAEVINSIVRLPNEVTEPTKEQQP